MAVEGVQYDGKFVVKLQIGVASPLGSNNPIRLRVITGDAKKMAVSE